MTFMLLWHLLGKHYQWVSITMLLGFIIINGFIYHLKVSIFHVHQETVRVHNSCQGLNISLCGNQPV